MPEPPTGKNAEMEAFAHSAEFSGIFMPRARELAADLFTKTVVIPWEQVALPNYYVNPTLDHGHRPLVNGFDNSIQPRPEIIELITELRRRGVSVVVPYLPQSKQDGIGPDTIEVIQQSGALLLPLSPYQSFLSLYGGDNKSAVYQSARKRVPPYEAVFAQKPGQSCVVLADGVFGEREPLQFPEGAVLGRHKRILLKKPITEAAFRAVYTPHSLQLAKQKIETAGEDLYRNLGEAEMLSYIARKAGQFGIDISSTTPEELLHNVLRIAIMAPTDITYSAYLPLYNLLCQRSFAPGNEKPLISQEDLYHYHASYDRLWRANNEKAHDGVRIATRQILALFPQ